MAVTLITVPDDISMARSPIFYRVQTDKDVSTTGLYLKAVLELTDTATEITTLVCYPDADGYAVFYLDALMVKSLSDSPIPAFNTGTWFTSTRCREFTLYFSDPDDSDLSPTPIESSIRAFNGGIPKKQFGKIINPLLNTIPRKYFLTARDGKKVFMTADQIAWWTIFHADDEGWTIQVRFRMYFRNYSEEYVDQIMTYDTMIAFDQLDVPVGPRNSGILDFIPTGATLLKYEVSVVSGSPGWGYYPYTIYIDEFRYKPRDFVFINFMGGMEFLRCHGDSEMSVDVANVTADKFVGYNEYDTIDFADRLIISSGERGSEKLNLGWQQLDDIGIARDFFASRSKYFVDYELERLIPVTVKSGSVVLGRKNETLHALEFEIEYLFDDGLHNFNNAFMQ